MGCGDTEGQAHLHTAGVNAHRLVDVVSDFGKGLNFRHQMGDLIDPVAKELARHEGILTAGEIGMEAHAELKHRRNTTGNVHSASGGLGGTSDHLEQGAFPRAVDADDPHRLAGIHCEVNVLQHPVRGGGDADGMD